VKGDVHDIGKNIVGVVLGCNNYEVIDLGVMVPCDRILDTAEREKVDIIGLSGLITPSLDEMHPCRARDGTPGPEAAPADRRRHHQPRPHRGEDRPGYRQPVVHVLDASRAVPVVSSLLSDTDRKRFVAESLAAITKTFAASTPATSAKPGVPRKPVPTLRNSTYDRLPQPEFTGNRLLDSVAVSDLVPFIDWSPFFHTWELRGVYPAIFDHPKHGEEARKLFADAQERLLERIARERLLQPRGVYGFFPATESVTTS
jgi:5-methyltetrahydrofolate--homocysteine methyltransferase